MGTLSKYFSRTEFACQGKGCCGGAAPVVPALVEALQALRDIVGKPLVINSGFRCPMHNAKVGGTPGSQHTFGTAADVAVPDGWTAQELADVADKLPAFRSGGIGVYATWVHLDVRTTGAARWRG